MFHLNSKEYHYILVANKVPPQYRGTPHLSFLQSIPWVAVFDLFDASSKTDGLHFICNEMTDAPRANIKTLDDFNEIFSDSTANKIFPLATRGTTWILQTTKLQGEDWITCSAKDCFYRALSAYKRCFPPGRLIIAILGLGENAIMEMSDIVESCFSILRGEIAKKCVTIITESKAILDAFIKNSKSALRKQLVDCSITDMSWSLLKEIVREIVGPNEFKEKEATTKLPYITGERKVLNKIIHSWDDLEVYCPDPRLPNLTEDIEKARDAFYKGTQASQVNLFYNHIIARTLEEEIIEKVEQAMKSLGNPSVDRTCCVKTINVPYEPGSGATTMCRRILWNKRKNYRCAVIKAITKATDFQIQQLQSIGYYEEQQNSSPPVLVLVDNFPVLDNGLLSEQLTKRETKCVIIATYPVETTGTTTEFEIEPLRQLDDVEMGHVRNILINITRDSGRRREAEEVLEREKRFIWFGLELFGRKYVKIEERLQNHINTTLAFLGASHARHEKLLNFCCFLHFYSNGAHILPHSFVVDFLYEGSDGTDKSCAQTSSIHDKFGGLLLEGFNESYGYHGWRPAHSLVSEVVKSRMNVDEIAVQLLENAESGKAYANKYLWEQLFQILSHRKRVSNLISLPQEEETPEDNIESDIVSDDQKCYEVRTRYSPLILDINAGKDGQRRTLEFLITVCQKANRTEDKAYAWQQLARFLGYEMRFKQLESKDALHSRLNDAINLSKGEEHQLPMPENGIKAAHIAIDIAIDQRRKYSHHYTTKGGLYVLQLRDVNTKDEHNLVTSMPDVIDIGRKALKVYDQAIQRMHGVNFYPVIGKIQVIVLLFKIFKSLPCFDLENNSFTRYLEVGEIPREMKDFLQQEDHNFVQNLGRTTFNLLNELFKDVKYRQLTTCDDNEFRNLTTTNTRACKLREEFYDITGFDRSKLVPTEEPLSPSSQKAPDIQQVVQDILFKNKETSYSGWCNLDNQVVSSIYRLLKPLCLQGNGSHDDMLIFSRVCIRLPRKEKPSVEEIDNVVQTWINKFSDSAWAHLFNYMIHFPIPNRSLLPTNLLTLASINKCCEMVQKRTGWRARKSAAEYFLGKGTGLIAIVSRQEFPELQKKWWQTKTDFWRSKEVSETLIRVRGQKLSQGVITYQGIRLRFDDMLYPSESKDDLWFYVGFSVAGPYAFDPVDDDTYSIMIRKQDKRKLPCKRVPNNVGRRAVSFDSRHRRKPRKMGRSTQRNPGTWELVPEDVGSTLDKKRAKTAFKTRSFRGGTNAVKRGPACMAGPGRQKSRKIGSSIQTNVDPSERCPTTSLGQNVQGQLPSRNSNVPREHVSSPCPRSTAFSTRSLLTRADNLRRPTAENPPSSAELTNRGDSQEKDIPNAEIQPPEASGAQKAAAKGVVSVAGKGSQKQCGRGRGIQTSPQATDDFPATSLERKYKEQLPSRHSHAPSELVNSFPYPKSAGLPTRSPLTIDDNLQRPAAAKTPPSSTELKNRVASQEKYIPNADIQAPKSAVAQKVASNAVRLGAVSLVGQSSRKPCGRGRGIQKNPHALERCPTTSLGQNVQGQFPIRNSNVPSLREHASSSCPRSTAFSTRSPLTRADNLRPTVTETPPSSAELTNRGDSQEKDIPNAEIQPPEASGAQKAAAKGVVSVAGKGSQKQCGRGRGIQTISQATDDFPAQKVASNAVKPGVLSLVSQISGKPCGRSRGIQKSPHASEDDSTTLLGQNSWEQLSSSRLDVQREVMEPSPSSRSTTFSTQVPLASDDNVQGPAATVIPPFCDSQVRKAEASQEIGIANIDSPSSEDNMTKKSASNVDGAVANDRGIRKPRGRGRGILKGLLRFPRLPYHLTWEECPGAVGK